MNGTGVKPPTDDTLMIVPLFFATIGGQKQPRQRDQRGDVEPDLLDLALDGQIVEAAARAKAGIVDQIADLEDPRR